MTTPTRNREIAMIKMAAKALGMIDNHGDDTAYRDMIGTVIPGKRSAADLDARERHQVIEHLKRKGWKPARSKTPRPDNPWAWVDGAAADRRPLLRKIIMLARELGYDKTSVETVLTRIGKGLDTPVEKLEFAGSNHLRAVVAELNQQVQRVDARRKKA